MLNRSVAVCASIVAAVLLVATTLFAQQPSSLSGFEPVGNLPPATEQLPAAPLLITAYAFAWVAILFYVWTIRRRLNKVEAEMRTLERRSGGR